MLKAHTRYYTAIGFAGSLVYDRGDYSGALLGWAELQEDIATGRCCIGFLHRRCVCFAALVFCTMRTIVSTAFFWLGLMPLRQHVCPTGHLAFMRWTPVDSMMPLPAFIDKKFTHLIYDQILIYNHAALSYLGTNTYLFFAGAHNTLWSTVVGTALFCVRFPSCCSFTLHTSSICIHSHRQ